MDDRKTSWQRGDSYAFACILLGALAIRLAFVLFVRPTPISDFQWYYTHALGIAHGSGYSTHGYPTAYWPPGWPYFLAGVIRLFGPSLVAAEIVQSLLNACTAAIVFLIARCIAGRTAGIAAGAVYAVLPSAVEWCATLASEPLYTTLCALATYIWISRSPQKLGWYACSGVILGAAALVRPSALLFWVILLAYLVTIRKEREHPARLGAAVAVTACCIALVVTPYTLRNYHVFGTFIAISNNGGASLYEGNNANSSSGETELNNPQIQKLLDDPRTELAGDKLASRLAVQYIVTHPLRQLWLSIRKVKALYANDDAVLHWTLGSLQPPPSDSLLSFASRLNNVTYFTSMLFAVFGIALCMLKERSAHVAPGWRLLFGMIVYNTLMFALIYGIDRFRYPIMPYCAVFSGIAIIAALGYVRNGIALRAQARTGA